jgi:ubiquitin C-terminal hydrolase
VFVVHLSQSTDDGHYIAYSNYDGIWSEYNDEKVTTSVGIDEIKDKAYYYCYRRIIDDYSAYIEHAAQSNVVEK